MAPVLLGDDDVRARLDAPTAVAAVRPALLAHHAGTLTAPPRVRADIGEAHLVLTAGRLRDPALHGSRVYDDRFGGEQLVAVWDTASGALRALAHGHELGNRRTGAIGGVAVDVPARPDARRLGVVGAGRQAWTQVWAIASVRDLEEVVVSSRRPERAAAFAGRVRRELGLPARAVDGAEEAVRGRDVVVTATTSPVPVLEAGWVEPGAHVPTVGPKTVTAHEVPAAPAARAGAVVTDSRAQAAAYGEGRDAVHGGTRRGARRSRARPHIPGRGHGVLLGGPRGYRSGGGGGACALRAVP